MLTQTHRQVVLEAPTSRRLKEARDTRAPRTKALNRFIATVKSSDKSGALRVLNSVNTISHAYSSTLSEITKILLGIIMVTIAFVSVMWPTTVSHRRRLVGKHEHGIPLNAKVKFVDPKDDKAGIWQKGVVTKHTMTNIGGLLIGRNNVPTYHVKRDSDQKTYKNVGMIKQITNEEILKRHIKPTLIQLLVSEDTPGLRSLTTEPVPEQRDWMCTREGCLALTRGKGQCNSFQFTRCIMCNKPPLPKPVTTEARPATPRALPLKWECNECAHLNSYGFMTCQNEATGEKCGHERGKKALPKPTEDEEDEMCVICCREKTDPEYAGDFNKGCGCNGKICAECAITRLATSKVTTCPFCKSKDFGKNMSIHERAKVEQVKQKAIADAKWECNVCGHTNTPRALEYDREFQRETHSCSRCGAGRVR